MKTQVFRGSGTAIITPMLADGRPNFNVFDELIEFQITGGSDAIVVCGTTGEASSMSDEEHLAVIERCVRRVGGRVPVVAGTGSNDTRHGLELSLEAERLGADALLHVTPYYNKTNQSGLVGHFTTIADAVNIPIILYNVPSRTGMTIAPATYKELAKHPRIVATKEASGDISHIANVAAVCGDELAIYSGNDDQVVPLLSLGGLGVISVVGNVAPRPMHDMCALWFEGKTAESLALQLQILPLNNALFSDVNPIPVKAAVNMMGYDAGTCRLPLGALSPEKMQALLAEMQRAGLVKN